MKDNKRILIGAAILAPVMALALSMGGGTAQANGDRDREERGERYEKEHGESDSGMRAESRDRSATRVREYKAGDPYGPYSPLYNEECGACHVAYPVWALPARSWERMMGELDNHFGDNAESDPETEARLLAYLVENAAENSGHEEAREFTTGTFPLSANGRAQAMNTPTGMIKVIADTETDELLGVHIFAPTASEMIAEAVVAMEFSASAEDLARIVHAHPTLSEAIHEAALAVDNRAIHI